jgi:hypothetical protein
VYGKPNIWFIIRILSVLMPQHGEYNDNKNNNINIFSALDEDGGLSVNYERVFGFSKFL